MVVLALLVIAAIAVGAVVLAGFFGRDAEPEAGTQPSPSAPPTAPVAEPSPSAPPTAAPTPAPAPTASSTPSATASEQATPTPQPSSSASGDSCGTDAVTLQAETDEESYGPGELPLLYLVVSNEGETPCTVNVGTSQMEFVITLDAERVFSSADCQEGSQDLELTIEPGDEERATFEWARNRTVPGCAAMGEEAAAGTYTLVTRLGARSSSPVTFTLS